MTVVTLVVNIVLHIKCLTVELYCVCMCAYNYRN